MEAQAHSGGQMPVDPNVLVLIIAALGLVLFHALRYQRRSRTTKSFKVRAVKTGWDALTPRELEIAELVAEGKRNSEIAEKLVLSNSTVANYLQRIYEK